MTTKKKRVSKRFTMPSKTQQSQKEETSIGAMVERYGPQVATYDPSMFGTAPDPNHLEQAMQATAQAQTEFEMMPAQVRAAFDHSFIAFHGARATEEGRAYLHSVGVDLAALGDAPFTPPKPEPTDSSAGFAEKAEHNKKNRATPTASGEAQPETAEGAVGDASS